MILDWKKLFKATVYKVRPSTKSIRLQALDPSDFLRTTIGSTISEDLIRGTDSEDLIQSA